MSFWQKVVAFFKDLFAGSPKAPAPKPAPDYLLQLIKEARHWVGTHEQGGNNKGPAVVRFQKAVDGKASGEPWCMSFVMFCIEEIEAYYKIQTALHKSEHCLTVWHRSPEMVRSRTPFPGAVVIWRHGDTSSGHTGIVTQVIDSDTFETVEGNTGPSKGVEREGDGVYAKTRSIHGAGEMRVVGFLRPFV